MRVDTSRIEKLPGISWALAHPRLAAWIVLSLGMIILLVVEARDVGLLATQWAALMVACVAVAGLCVWIISWEDGDEDAAQVVAAQEAESKPAAESEQPAEPSAEVAAASAETPAETPE
jgi:hypothetical protein